MNGGDQQRELPEYYNLNSEHSATVPAINDSAASGAQGKGQSSGTGSSVGAIAANSAHGKATIAANLAHGGAVSASANFKKSIDSNSNNNYA